MSTAAPTRPEVVLFDVFGTVLDLEGLRPRFEDVGRSGHELELFFARLLRDGMALTLAGEAAPFADIATGVLATTSGLDNDAISHIVGGFSELGAHPDAEPAFRALADAGLPPYAFTHGSAQVAETALENAGLRGLLHGVFSAAEIKSFKPPPRVYHWACEQVGSARDRTALVAAHSWDCHGAARAGLLAGYASRGAGPPAAVFDRPTVVADTLDGVVARLLALE